MSTLATVRNFVRVLIRDPNGKKLPDAQIDQLIEQANKIIYDLVMQKSPGIHEMVIGRFTWTGGVVSAQLAAIPALVTPATTLNIERIAYLGELARDAIISDSNKPFRTEWTEYDTLYAGGEWGGDECGCEWYRKRGVLVSPYRLSVQGAMISIDPVPTTDRYFWIGYYAPLDQPTVDANYMLTNTKAVISTMSKHWLPVAYQAAKMSLLVSGEHRKYLEEELEAAKNSLLDLSVGLAAHPSMVTRAY